MNELMTSFICLVVAFFASMICSPLFIKISEKYGAKQTILSYVEQHKEKQHVPTMAGMIIIFVTVGISLAFGGYDSTLSLSINLILLAYGIIGFLDDFIKIAFKRNLGLRPYQKIISQIAISVIVGCFCYKSQYIGSDVYIPILHRYIDFGWFYIPFATIALIAMTNAVNLTDGLDGLAGTTSTIYFVTFFIIIAIELYDAIQNGSTLYGYELQSLLVFVATLIGSMTGFLWFNSNKAKYFMGDTGSLAIGGVAGAVALFIKNPLSAILIGIVFVISAVSVIVQVVSFKVRKKRVFLMAPLHHHLELKGYNESKIVAFYGIITAIAGVISLILL